MNLDIILRTHDASNVHTDRQRYCNADKKTVVIKCVASLINSAKLAYNYNINIKVIDDHSSEETKNELYKILESSKIPFTFTNLLENGYNYSALKQYELCRDSTADLFYCVEDDYLHCPSAIVEMLDSYEIFSKKIEIPIAIYPFDMPDDYIPPWMEPCFVVHGSARHWKTGSWTTNTMMTTPSLIQKFWPIFEKFATKYNGDYSIPQENRIDESNTICLIWKNYAKKFSPIQSLALHLQFEQQKDPYIDWKYWWDNYTKY